MSDLIKKGILYMIPCPIVENKNDTIPLDTMTITHGITHFVVERARTARRWLSSTKHPIPIKDLNILEMDKNSTDQDLSPILSVLDKGIDVGVISEAGCPGIADPGNKAVRYAHNHGYRVSPLVGPNSILLALMASGFNGQNFAFHGYLPNKKPALPTKLKHLEQQMLSNKQTQIFMEAPYRNEFLLEQICNTLSNNIMLTVACDINATSEKILTQSVEKWKKTNKKQYHKRPTIFVIGQ